MRITAAAPEALISSANQLAMCLGTGPAEILTYGTPSWQDADGNLYSAASWIARPEWVDFAQAPLVRPAWDTDEIIDMDAAERAQAAMVYSVEAIPAAPGVLAAIGDMEAQAAVDAMGLTMVPQVVEE